MKNYVKNHLLLICSIALAVVHTLVTFLTDSHIFSVPASENYVDYILCKIIAFAALGFFYYGVLKLLFCKERQQLGLWAVIKCALPYLLVIAAVCVIKLPSGYLSNDEALIADAALKLQHYTWFYYLTTYFYIVSFMLIPHSLAPIFIKLLIEFLVVGYVVWRFKRYFGKPYWYFSYLLFLLYPVIAYTTSAHRLPVYFLLYLFLMVMMIFDRLEGVILTTQKGVGIVLLGALLTQWRTEGIYLALFVPILMLFAYKNLRNRRFVIGLVVTSAIVQYLVSVPQNGFVAKEMGAAATDRMKPFYAYTITNMWRNGLDLDANAEDLAIVDQYMSLEKIQAINDYYGDINYEDVLILYEGDFVGVREEADVTEFFAYAEALKRIFINNPGVFLKTRIGAFCYAALPYRIDTTGGIKSLAISIVKSISYNLFIPLLIILAVCIGALIKKEYFHFCLTLGVLGHWFIVFILAPASYFKYYFPVYIMAYFYVLYLLLRVVRGENNS